MDQHGEPVAGYPIFAFYTAKNNSTRGDVRGVTNAKGEFEINNCPYHENLSLKFRGDCEPGDWGRNDYTKDKKFVFFPDRTVTVPFEEGKHEYHINIVVQKPEVEVLFMLRNVEGKPIEGMPVYIQEDYSHRNRKLNGSWAQSLWGQSDKDGIHIAKGLPEIDHIRFDIRPEYLKADQKEVYKNLLGYQRVYCQIKEIPINKKGYVVEVVMTKKGQQLGENKRVKIFDSKGDLVYQN